VGDAVEQVQCMHASWPDDEKRKYEAKDDLGEIIV
jgi:hypothetical protein